MVKISKYLTFAVIFSMLLYISLFNVNKAIWWDEGEYLLMARSYFTGNTAGFWVGRPAFYPLLISVIFNLSGENLFLIKLIQMLFYVGCVFLTYLLAEFFIKNKIIALSSTIAFASSWLLLFYSLRILLHAPQTFFILLSIYLLFLKEGKKYTILSGIAISLAFFTRWDTFVSILALFVFLILTSKKKIPYWLIGIGIPFLIMGFHDFDYLWGIS